MFSDILVISDALVEPPSEVLPLRAITLFVHYDLGADILLHSTQEMKDLYFHFMKRTGLFDYFSYILNEFEFEEGIRLDPIGIYPYTIITKYVRLENQIEILGKIKSLSKG